MPKKKEEMNEEVVSAEKARRLAFVEKYKASNPVRFERVKAELDAWVNQA